MPSPVILEVGAGRVFASAVDWPGWRVFDATVATSPQELRRGPHGGGRDRDRMAEHVLGAEASYARMIGVRHRQPDLGDRAAIEALRRTSARCWPSRQTAYRCGTGAGPSGTRPAGSPGTYSTTRHAWEMRDRSVPA